MLRGSAGRCLPNEFYDADDMSCKSKYYKILNKILIIECSESCPLCASLGTCL